MSAETMKMPDPIMDPTTSSVASVSVSPRRNCDGDDVPAAFSGATVATCQSPGWRSLRNHARARRGALTRRKCKIIALEREYDVELNRDGIIAGIPRRLELPALRHAP